jgi:hypothetical protein
MKTTMHVPALPARLACVLPLLAAGALFAAGTNAGPRSVFTDDPQNGKDPFFPDSTRRLKQIATASNAAPASVAGQLTLKGIAGTKARPLALINNLTFSAGESGEVKCAQQHVRIRCREIRDRSVIVEISTTGEVMELKLREGI